jgi:hypothetical protein
MCFVILARSGVEECGHFMLRPGSAAGEKRHFVYRLAYLFEAMD